MQSRRGRRSAFWRPKPKCTVAFQCHAPFFSGRSPAPKQAQKGKEKKTDRGVGPCGICGAHELEGKGDWGSLELWNTRTKCNEYTRKWDEATSGKG